MAPLNVGLLGCGRLGRQVMLPLLAARRDVRVAVVADSNPDARAAAAAAVPGVSVEADWRHALGRPNLGAVVITVPTALHAEIARAAIERRVPAYVEKPLAGSLAEATEIRDLWRRIPVPVAVGFNRRFHPLIVQLREGLDRGRIGTPRLVRCAFTVAARPAGTWRDPAVAGGGVLLDLASHHIDLIRFLLAREFSAVTASSVVGVGTEAIVVAAELEGGATVSGTWASGTVDEDAIEVIGTTGAVRVSRYEDLAPVWRQSAVSGAWTRTTRLMPSAAALRFAASKRRSPWHDPSFAAALDAFFAAIGEDRACVPGVDDGWQSARVVAAIAEAAATGHRVGLTPTPGPAPAHHVAPA